MPKNRFLAPISALFFAFGLVLPALADLTTPDSISTRYGPLNLLDSRSSYGQGIFPEPFLVDDSDFEQNEARLDWFYSEAHDSESDLIKAEIEHGLGLVTLELEVPFERDSSLDPETSTHTTLQAFDNISVGARAPIFQFVSPDNFVDNTLGTAIEVGIPVNTPLSRDTEIVPKIFDDLAIGKHFTLQTIEGYSTLLGPGDDHNLETFEYAFVFGWTIHRQELPLPAIEELIPVFELKGETELNKDHPGHNSLLGNAALRFDLDSIGPIQPRLGIGYVFPIDKGARDDFHWGIFTSLVFEF